MSYLPKGGVDSSHRSEILWRFSDSEVVMRKGSHGERRGKRGRGRKLKRKQQLPPGCWTLQKMHRTKLIWKRTTDLCAAHICVTERNKRWRKMKNIRAFSSPHFPALVNYSPKSLAVFLPPGPRKHLTLLTSLPERAQVRGRQRDSKMRENWREKDESSRKRRHFHVRETLTFREGTGMVQCESCLLPGIVQQNKPACASLYCSLQDYNCLFFHLLHLNLT